MGSCICIDRSSVEVLILTGKRFTGADILRGSLSFCLFTSDWAAARIFSVLSGEIPLWLVDEGDKGSSLVRETFSDWKAFITNGELGVLSILSTSTSGSRLVDMCCFGDGIDAFIAVLVFVVSGKAILHALITGKYLQLGVVATV